MRRYADVKWNSVNAMIDGLPAPLSRLAWRRRARLYLRLCEARCRYDFWGVFDAVPTPKIIAKELGSIEASLMRIARFAKQAYAEDDRELVEDIFDDKCRSRNLEQEALAILCSVGEQWAAAQSEALPAGFEARPYRVEDFGEAIDYGARTFLARFFRGTQAAYEIVRKARAYLASAEKPNDGPSPERWLIGKRLPEIYAEIFGSELKVNTWEGVADSASHAGNEFVLRALAVMKVEPGGGGDWSLETIKSHMRLAQQGERTSKIVVPSP